MCGIDSQLILVNRELELHVTFSSVLHRDRELDSKDFYRLQGKVMLSQASVCPQSASWLLAHPCYGTVGTHATGMLSCFKYIYPACVFEW